MTDFAAFIGQLNLEWFQEVVEEYSKITNRSQEWARQVLGYQKNGVSQMFDEGLTPLETAQKVATYNLDLPPARRRGKRCGG